MTFQNTREFAQSLDAQDELSKYQSEFEFPQLNGKKVIYFTGNSLGLLPKRARKYIDDVMNDWSRMGVEGHFFADKPWWDYHERFSAPLSKIVGALPSEVSVMNTLTVNLHLMMVSFYRPTTKRFKIICEEKAFPSDQYMLQTQVASHGLDPKDVIVEVPRREGEHNLRNEDIIAKIKEVGDELALVLIGGINYYTGQVLDMKAITQAGHEVGAKVGWDLAHAAGNIEMSLHDWQVDFACWCSYKYMNAGPGSVSGYFVHEKHHQDKTIPRFGGWYGHNKERRFLMEPTFDPNSGALGWQSSCTGVLAMAPYLASVEMFDEIGMEKISKKRDQLTDYLAFIIQQVAEETNSNLEIITPNHAHERGSQLSVILHGQGKDLFNYLMKNGVIVDWREPAVIRLAPVPLYSTYEEMYEFGRILTEGIRQMK